MGPINNNGRKRKRREARGSQNNKDVHKSNNRSHRRGPRKDNRRPQKDLKVHPRRGPRRSGWDLLYRNSGRNEGRRTLKGPKRSILRKERSLDPGLQIILGPDLPDLIKDRIKECLGDVLEEEQPY